MSATGAVLEGGRTGERLLSLLAGSGHGIEYLLQRGTSLKADDHSQSWLVDIEGQRCFAKLYRHKSLLRRLLPASTARRPRRAYRMGVRLHGKGIAVARPLCCARVEDGILLLTEALQGSDPVAAQWPSLPPQRRAGVLDAAAQSLASMHAKGYSHGDCKWQNLVMVDGACFLVDLDRVRNDGDVSRRQARDIARFTVAAEEAGVERGLFDVFLHEYRARGGRKDAAFMARVVKEAERVRRRHEQRYGIVARPLV